MITLSIPWQINPRWELIQHCVDLTKNRSYLEIGCDKNDVFDRIASEIKIGVDPESGGTHRMCSDDFFNNNIQKFDVIYIDGLHHYDQVSRDIENSLLALSDLGFLIIHDMLPDHQEQTQVPRPLTWPGSWTGDVWRSAFDLMRRSDITFVIAKIDCGCGVVWKLPQRPTDIEVENSWHWYQQNWQRLPLYTFEQVLWKTTFVSNGPSERNRTPV